MAGTKIVPKNRKRKHVANNEVNKEQEENVDNGTELNKEHEPNAENPEYEVPEGENAHEETLHDHAASEEHDPVQHLPKRRRGPTRMLDITRDPNARVPVEFTEFGEPCGPGSVKLSSYLGPLVREHVPIIIKDWRNVGESIKTVLWKSIQLRFEMDEEYQRAAVFRQMGYLWRSSKSRVVSKIRKAKTMKERMQLKPSNINPIDWRRFVNYKTSSAFKEVSDSYKERRQKQIPHTVSRKGMVRLTEEMKKSCPEPSQLTRLKVWVKSRTKKDGTPVNNEAAEKMRKAKDVEITGAPSSSSMILSKNDALAQILGPDNPGRLRVMGRGMSTTKLACFQVKSAHMSQMQEKQTQLQEKVHELETLLMRMNNHREDEQGETSAPRSVNKSLPAKCLLVDWTGTEETVAEGRLLSADPEEYVNDIPLGPNSVKVLVESAIIPDAFLWRPSIDMTCIEQAVGKIIALRAGSCVGADEEVCEDIPKSPNISSKNRCKLMDWTTDDEKLVAEGRWHSGDPQDLVNGIPLGPNAVKVYVDVVLSPHAFPWRPTVEIKNMEQTANRFIAWPANKVEKETHTKASTHKSPQPLKFPPNSTSKIGSSPSLQKSLETLKSSTAAPLAFPQTSPPTPTAPPKAKRNMANDNQKCKLMDIIGRKRVVAEGRWSGNDPDQSVHFVPLGPNAVRVWVDVVKIKTAAVWRTSSAIETMEDALGAPIAWPEDKVVMC